MIAMMCETAGNDLMAPGFRIPFVHAQRSRTNFPNDPNDCFFFSFLVAPAEDDDHYEELPDADDADDDDSWIGCLPVPVPSCLFFEDEEEPALSETDDDILISIRELFESDSVEDNLDFRCEELDEHRDENMSRGLLRSDWSDSWTYWHPDENHIKWVHQRSNHPPVEPNQRNIKVHDVPKLGRSGRFFKSTRKLVARAGRSIMNCFCLPYRR
jgi:hypothetical protein